MSDVAKKVDETIKYLEEHEDVRLNNFINKDPQGLGDTLERVFAKFGVTEEVISKAMGLGGCGCHKRKQFLNKIFPYRKRAKKKDEKAKES